MKRITSTISEIREESEFQQGAPPHVGVELAPTSFLPSTIGTEIGHEPSLFYYFFKRLIDFVLVAIGLIALLPVFLIIAMCIKLDDGGDILHFREVIGQHGKRFYALKFRT